jgi:chromatin remodeling complex protein RSC6
MKAAKKITARKVKRVGNRQPSGFVRPTLISDELADFLGVDHGSMMARTTVSGLINAYIRSNSLQDKDNGRIIVPDDKLKSLLCDVEMTENLLTSTSEVHEASFHQARPCGGGCIHRAVDFKSKNTKKYKSKNTKI